MKHFTQNVGAAAEGVNPKKNQGIVKLSLSFQWKSSSIEMVFWKRPIECSKGLNKFYHEDKARR